MPVMMLDKVCNITVHMLSLPKVEMISHSSSTPHHNLRLIFVFFIFIGFCNSCGVRQTQPDAVAQAFERHQSDVIVDGEGVVLKILSDDTERPKHQRFILRLASGQTVLIQHNIDVAPRINDLKVDDTVRFLGEYVWNQQGGVIHWTHHDPANRHQAGWLKHAGRTYE